jgi:hypothetical protein
MGGWWFAADEKVSLLLSFGSCLLENVMIQDRGDTNCHSGRVLGGGGGESADRVNLFIMLVFVFFLTCLLVCLIMYARHFPTRRESG